MRDWKSQRIDQIIAAELDFRRQIAYSSIDTQFRCSGTTSELLLLLAASEARAEDGISQTLKQIETPLPRKARPDEVPARLPDTEETCV